LAAIVKCNYIGKNLSEKIPREGSSQGENP
jgi:hypothetical protein